MAKIDPEKLETREVWLSSDTWFKVDRAAKRCHISIDTWLAYALAYVEETRWRDVLSFHSVESMLEGHYAPFWMQGVHREPEPKDDDIPY